MRTAVIGTSNSILVGGYVDQLSAMIGPHRLRNLSVGGSTIHLLSYTAAKYDLSQYNLVFIDLMVNEYAHQLRVGHDLVVSLRILDGFLAEIKAAGATPVFLVFPHRHATENNGAHFVKHYVSMAQTHGVPVINLYDDFAHARAAGAPIQSLWRDDAHLALDFHAKLAERLAAFVNAMTAQGWLPPDEEALSKRSPFSSHASFDVPGGDLPIVERGSRLLKLNYLGLPLNQAISFRSQDSALYGLAYNAVKFSGKVEITANGQQSVFELDDAQAETTTKPAEAPFRHRIVGFPPLTAPPKQSLSGQIKFTPYDTCPAEVAEIECLFGGRLANASGAISAAA